MRRTKTSLSKDFKDNLIEYIKSNYYKVGVCATSIAKDFGITFNTASKYIKKAGVRKKTNSQLQTKYDFDRNWVRNIDNWSPFHYYFMGWLASDGHLNSNDSSVQFSLSYKDREVLELFKSRLNFTGDIKKYIQTTKGKRQEYAFIAFRNKEFRAAIEEFGFCSRKTVNHTFPEWNHSDNFKYYLRGYFEGDGCIYFNKKNKSYFFSLIGTKSFIEGLSQYLKYRYNLIGNIYYNKNCQCAQLSFKNTGRSLHFLNTIYDGEFSLVLKRKFSKYLELIEITKNPNRIFRKATRDHIKNATEIENKYNEFINIS